MARPSLSWSPPARYGAAILLVIAAFAGRLMLAPVFGKQSPFVTFYLAVLAGAALLGTGPAMMITSAAAILTNVYFMDPFGRLSLSFEQWIWLSFYLLVSGAMIAALHAERRAYQNLEAAKATLTRQAADLAVQVQRTETAQRAEAALREWYETTLRSIGDGVVVTDETGKVMFLNPVAEELTGWPLSEARGRPIQEIFKIHNEETLQPVEIPVSRVLREGHVAGLANHTMLMTRTGLGTPVDDSAAPIYSASRELLGVVLVFRDITVRRAAERALEQSREDMERFAYLAAHDLQEPLRGVSTFAEMLERRSSAALDDSGRTHLRFILDGTRKMQALVVNLLQYCRAGAAAVELKRVDSRTVLKNALSSLESAIAECEAGIEVGPLPEVLADDVKLGQVFQNLIANAIKFRGSDPCRIAITCETDPGNHTFRVRDNGVGFDPRHAGRIFEMFQRLHSRPELLGSGIGLAISKRIVESHQGRMWAESQPGKGASFYFTLPVIREGALSRSAER